MTVEELIVGLVLLFLVFAFALGVFALLWSLLDTEKKGINELMHDAMCEKKEEEEDESE